MASKKAYQKALKAAHSVVAGRKQGKAAALAGLALIAYLPACTTSTPDTPTPVDSGSDVTTMLDTSNSDVQQVLSDIHDMLSTDTPMIADEGTPPVDEGSTPVDEGSTPVDEGAAPVDEGAAPVDAMAGWVNNHPETCMQASGESCTTNEDCTTLSANCKDGDCMVGEGAWDPSDVSCSAPTDCGDEDMCYQGKCHTLNAAGLVAAQCCADVMGETGCLQPTDESCTENIDCTGQMECVNEICHVSQLSNAHPLQANVMECCSAWYNLEGCNSGIPMGCYPWGPPAPPSYNGVRLKDLMQAEVA